MPEPKRQPTAEEVRGWTARGLRDARAALDENEAALILAVGIRNAGVPGKRKLVIASPAGVTVELVASALKDALEQLSGGEAVVHCQCPKCTAQRLLNEVP